MAASAAEIPTDNRNEVKTFSANGVIKLFINGTLAVVNGLKKLRYPAFWVVIFVAVPFNKITLFSTDLIIFLIFFISLFVRVIAGLVTDEIPFLIFSPSKLSPAFLRISLFFVAPIFIDSFAIVFANENLLLNGAIGGSDIPDEENRNPHNLEILDNYVLQIFILVDEPFAKALKNCENCVSVNNSLCEKLVSLLDFPKVDERFRVTSVPFFTAYFNLLSYTIR